MRFVAILLLTTYLPLTPRPDGSAKTVSEKTKVWVEQGYLECLRRSLPCECLDDVEYSILIAPADFSKVTAYEKIEVSGFYTKKIGRYGFDVFADEANEHFLFHVKMKGNYLSVVREGKTRQYTQVKNLSIGGDDASLDERFNFLILKATMDESTIDICNLLNISESTARLGCSDDLGNVNVLRNEGSCENKWILERSSNELCFYEFVNSCDDKRYPPNVVKERKYAVTLKVE